jgi:hypothetical protein
MHYHAGTNRESRAFARSYLLRPVTFLSLSFALALSFTAVFTRPVHAQSAGQLPVATGPGRVVGTIVTFDGGQPVGAAAVTIRTAKDSTMVTGSITTANGKFRIDGLAPGTYLVRVSHLAYKPINTTVTITADAPAQDLGDVKLEAQSVELAAITATAEKSPIVIEADRTTYTTKDMPAAAGNAIELLRAVPELEVDVNDKVSLRGNQSVAIHINGRPAPMQGDALTNFLKQFPGNRIAKVEVVPNPSAKNDPEGMGGILNLILKENVDLGLSGSLSAGGSSKGSRNTSGRVNYQKGRFTLFAGGNYYWSDNDYDAYDLRTNLLAHPVTMFEQTSHATNGSGSGGMDLTSELRVGKQATFYTSVWAYQFGYDSDRLTNWGILDTMRTMLDRYDRNAHSENSNMNADATIGFKQVFQPQRHEITVDLRRTMNGSDSDSEDEKTFLDPITGEVRGVPSELSLLNASDDTRELSLQADYIRPWGAKGRIGLGVRAYGRRQSNDQAQNVFEGGAEGTPINESLSAYAYDENFQSSYLTVSQSYKQLGLQLGVRTEFAQTTFRLPLSDGEFSNDYNSIFPSGNLSYDLKQGRTVRFNYSRRIGRPYPYILNPTNASTDPLNLYIGNPQIRPNYTNSFGLDFSKIGSKGTVRLAPYYRKTVDNWDQIRTVDSLGVSTMTWANTTSIVSYGSNLTFSLRPTGRLSGSASLNAYREERDADNIAREYSRSANRWSANGFFGYKVTKDLSASLNGFYMPARNLLQGRQSGFVQMSTGLRQNLWGTKGSMSLFIQDPFNMYHFTFTTADKSHTQNSSTTTRIRQASLSFTYNFGKPPQQNSRRQDGDSGGGATSTIR